MGRQWRVLITSRRAARSVFTNGNGTNTFIVPIINNNSAVGARTFSVRLFNPTAPGRLVASDE